MGFLRDGSSREDEAWEFIEAPFEAVDCALLVLSESVRQVIHDRVERSYQVKREEIPVILETLHKALGDFPTQSRRFFRN